MLLNSLATSVIVGLSSASSLMQLRASFAIACSCCSSISLLSKLLQVVQSQSFVDCR